MSPRRTTLLFGSLLALFACEGDVMEPTLRPEPERLVSTEWLSARLTDPSIVVIQVGTQAKYLAGHIPGARFVATAAIAPTIDGVPFELPALSVLEAAFEAAGVSDDSHVVLYADAGVVFAARAFFTLDYLGHSRVSLLDGGLDRWKAEARPLSTDAVSPARGAFSPRVRREAVVTADWLHQRLEDPDLVHLDARAPAEYQGDEGGSFAPPRLGHIPGARNLPWRNLLRSSTDQRLDDTAALIATFEATGAMPGKRVVTSCITGVLGSMLYFTARYLGYEVSLYDGSFLEWSRREELPVARCGTPFCP